MLIHSRDGHCKETLVSQWITDDGYAENENK